MMGPPHQFANNSINDYIEITSTEHRPMNTITIRNLDPAANERARFAPFGGVGDLHLPPREPAPEPPHFG